jgi:hypothetical protein
MIWTNNEQNAIYEAWARGPGDVNRLESLLAIATSAVEIMMARGGTMTVEVLRETFAFIEGPGETNGNLPNTGKALRQHIAAQGARVAALEEEVSRLRGAGQILSQHVDKTSGGPADEP